MRIDRLYTLSQFVDYLNTEDAAYNFSDNNVNYMFDEHRWQCIEKYNKFLKQSLKKEMFVNEIEKPDESDYCDVEGPLYHGDHQTGSYDTEGYQRDLKVWQEAEKKMIFEKSYIDGRWLNIQGWDYELSKALTFDLNTIAEITNGQLKLKNCEI